MKNEDSIGELMISLIENDEEKRMMELLVQDKDYDKIIEELLDIEKEGKND